MVAAAGAEGSRNPLRIVSLVEGIVCFCIPIRRHQNLSYFSKRVSPLSQSKNAQREIEHFSNAKMSSVAAPILEFVTRCEFRKF
jgi:hypothetical protein